jgi:glucose/arabinose dehydrogenase/mono/diheme cytochrome c family protein
MMPRFFSSALLVFLSLPAFVLAQKGDRPGEAQPPPPKSVKAPPAPALPVEEALKTIKVAPGFHLEVVASEPLVFDPVAIAFGADGRLWVVEMRAFMPNIDGKGENEPIGSVAVLEDTDGDGRMDKRTVFLDSLVLPRAVLPVADGALVAEPPHLWFARDKNGDGVADEKIQIAADYGSPVNPEHTANGLMWALDNWIYSANHTVRFRYEGDGKFTRDLTITRGQWGISQDDAGRIFYNSNSDPLRADLLPSEYLKRNPNIAPTGTNVQLVPATLRVWPGRVTPGINRGYKSLDAEGKMYAVTAACGPVVYRGTLFPPEFRGNVFICEPAGNLIKRIALDTADPELKGRNAYDGTEFITSTDERFRPVNLFNGPDGALYIVDMYRGLIQHRTYVTTYLRKQVEERHLERPVGMGRIYRVVPDGAPPANFRLKLARATTSELVESLGDPNGWTRDAAQKLLVERALDPARRPVDQPGGVRAESVESVAPVVRDFALKSKNPLGRLHAFWTLSGMNAIDPEFVLHALGDADPRVQSAGLRLAEEYFSDEKNASVIFPRVASLAGSADPNVRLQAALTLGEAHAPAAAAALRATVIANPSQLFLAEAAVSGLNGREDAFIAALGSEVKPNGAPPAAAVTLATQAVLKSSEPARIDRVFALAADRNSPAWLRRAILDGTERFLPKSPEGKTLLGGLPAEPKPLLALAAEKDSADGKRATSLLASLKWPGKPGLKTAAVAELTPAQKALFEKGRAQFAMVCAACHQPAGQGLAGLAPPLVNSSWVLGDERILARIVLCGKADENLIMPSMRVFDDETLAGVLTFIRRSWGHEAAPVAPSVVTQARAAVAGREEPWSVSDLVELQQELADTPGKK